MTVVASIRKKLEGGFAPLSLDVIDESEKHRGHGGWREGGGTHFRVRMVSAAFAGQSRVARERAVQKALEAEFAAGLHALALELRAPSEV